MTIAITGKGQPYVVACHACGTNFDALSAPWCTCIAREHNPVCPSCEKCLCEAPLAYRTAIWEQAPDALWETRARERRRPGVLKPNPSSGVLPRPFVLVADDDPAMLCLIVAAVESFGYPILHASDGISALELVRQHRPDLVITDALMPRLDGREMCREIKSDPALVGTKIVVLTGLYRGVFYSMEARRAYKADDFLAKPLSIPRLGDVLARFLPVRRSGPSTRTALARQSSGAV